MTGKGGTDFPSLENWVGYSNMMPASSGRRWQRKAGSLNFKGDRDRGALAFKAHVGTSEGLELNLNPISSVQLLCRV